MLEVKNLRFRHKRSLREVLKGITFGAQKGEITTILGPNGAGKSTLFKCITGLWGPYEGEIRVEGKRVEGLSFDKRAKIFAIVPQDHEPPFPYTVFEVVLMGRASYVGILSTPSKEDYQKAEEALELVGISHLKELPYTKISGGERQLTLIARALAQDAPVLILDEPTSHLDFKNQFQILSKIKEIVKEKNLTSIITLHDPNLASIFSDKVVVIKEGRLVNNGEPREIINEKVLKEVYGIEVEVINHNGFNLVLPRA